MMDWEPRVGMRVVCVDGFSPSFDGETLPVVGHVYTVRSVYYAIGHDGAFLRFHEIANPEVNYDDYFGEAQFHQSGFKPLEERKTDISIFTSMLAKAPTEKEPA